MDAKDTKSWEDSLGRFNIGRSNPRYMTSTEVPGSRRVAYLSRERDSFYYGRKWI